MIGIFFLYMTTDGKEGGMGWENATASDIYGTFIALAYLTPFMGGLLADLKLGYRFSITLGGILMGIGYCLLAIPEKWAFFCCTRSNGGWQWLFQTKYCNTFG